jgi:hypothetical protein
MRSSWTVTYSKPPSEAQINAENGDYDAAQRKTSKRVGALTTLEQLWSAINSLPAPHQLPKDDCLIFAREGVEPQFSSFPNGTRIALNCSLEAMGKHAYELTLALVLGESITDATDGKPVVDVIRARHTPFKNLLATIRVELWLNDKEYLPAIVAHIKPKLHQQFPTIELREMPMK